MQEDSPRSIQDDEINQREISNAWAEKGFLQSVIDPHDKKGLKCDYIDRWSRHYIRRFVEPTSSSIVLEVGCGSGRNLFALAPSILHGHGTDIAERQIQNAIGRRDAMRTGNLSFHVGFPEGADWLKQINCMFTMWVLSGFSNDTNMVKFLTDQLERLSSTTRFVFFEQVAIEAYDVSDGGRFRKRVRTFPDYRSIFDRAGLSISEFALLPEKGHGPMYRLLYQRCYRLVPRWLNLNWAAFALDKVLVRRRVRSSFTDAVFVCHRTS